MSAKLVKINDIKYDPELFEAWEMNSPLDTLFSIGGGIPKATNWMCVGDPGVGKSTVLLDAICNTKKNGARVLFVSGEMNQVDLYLYVQRYPKFGDIEIFFPQELDVDESPKQALEELLQQGWDIVLYDSFVEIQETIKEVANMSTRGSEKWMLDLMNKHNLANNDRKCYTSFLNIQQVTKGGKFVGSNRLKHMTTGMMEMRFADENEDERYVSFDKNRRGHVGKRMYFSLHSEGDVTYDIDKFDKAEKLHEMKQKEKELIKAGEASFESLFKLESGEDPTEAVPTAEVVEETN
jgi:predicted ATP-dependent serine protease